jgi:ATP-dependent RNA helicase RhlB
MEFSELNLHPDLARGIAEAGYVTCTPVQEQVLTRAFNGQDLYVQSQTGTGKTAAFLIVIFERFLTETNLTGKKALIMSPTRELAVQIEEEARALGRYLPYGIGSFYGGVGYGEQQRRLKEEAQILVGTPGRVLDLNGSGWMNLMDLAFLVLDEADRMFDMGFYPDLRKLIKVVPPADKRQTMLFSATLNAWVKNLAWEYTKTPYEIEIEPETVTLEEIEQYLYHVPSEEKLKLLLGILEREQPESALIFCNTKRYAEIVAKRLRINGYDCEYIMGDLPQSKRLKIIEDVKAGKIRYLVATDVAARGLDIEGLAMVVNYDVPVETENYVHRIGRTARAGKTGKAITLSSEQDVYELPSIERYIGKKIPSEIAQAGLYAEDKSEGMRIRTEFAELRDRESGRDGSRGGPRRRPEGRVRESRDGRGPDRNAGERGERPDRRRRSDAPGAFSAGDSPAGASRKAGGGRPPERPLEQVPERLAALPLDERMAYYREKYAAGSAPGAARREAPEPPASRGGRGGRRTRGAEESPGGKGPDRRPAKPAGRPSGAADAAKGAPASPGADPAKRNRRRRGKDAARPGAAPQGAAPVPQAAGPQAADSGTPKKGILSRLIGLFKK